MEDAKKIARKWLFPTAIVYIVAIIFASATTNKITINDSFAVPVVAMLMALVLSLQQNPRLFLMLISVFSFPTIPITLARMDMGFDFAPLNVYLSIAHEMSIGCLILLFVSFLKKKKFEVAFVAAFIWLSFNILFFGFIFAEGGWPNEDTIIAIMQTDLAEALHYVERRFGVWTFPIIAFMFFSSRAIAKQCEKLKIKEDITYKWIPFSIVLLSCSFLVYVTTYNILVLPIPRAIIFFNQAQDFKEKHIEENAIQPNILSKPFGGVYIIAIGEAETKDHMHAFGYEKETTPWLSSKTDAILFTNAYASYPSTIKALGYALSAKNQYNGKTLSEMPTIIEVAKAAGMKTAYLSNHSYYSIYNMPISFIEDSADEKIWLHKTFDRGEHFDEELVQLFDKIDITDNMLIIVHLIGSHEPVQYRYPEKYKKFNDELLTERINHYDNTVVYTDDVLKHLYERAKKIPNFQGFVYFSDHGEGIDDNLEHGVSKFTWQMARIPVFAIFSEKYKQEHKEKYETLKKNAKEPFTNDLIFDLMTDIMGIEIEETDKKNTISSNTYNADWDRFLTLFGEKKITEDKK